MQGDLIGGGTGTIGGVGVDVNEIDWQWISGENRNQFGIETAGCGGRQATVVTEIEYGRCMAGIAGKYGSSGVQAPGFRKGYSNGRGVIYSEYHIRIVRTSEVVRIGVIDRVRSGAQVIRIEHSHRCFINKKTAADGCGQGKIDGACVQAKRPVGLKIYFRKGINGDGIGIDRLAAYFGSGSQRDREISGCLEGYIFRKEGRRCARWAKIP